MSDLRLLDDNPDWLPAELPGWEPWEPDEEPDVRECGCAYCGNPDVRDIPEPYGGKPCCDPCFSMVIGGEPDDRPWRCGTPAWRVISAAFNLEPPAAGGTTGDGQ